VDNDEPYVVPVCFGYERNALYFHGASAGRKMELIRKNSRVCFEIDTDVAVIKKAEKPCDWTTKYRSVIGVGRARILESDREKLYGLKVLMRHYAGGEFAIPEDRLKSVSVVKIDIESVTGKKSGY
jgi:nitroimidazol reductase NimA-like FMN-containing flavoprotein (pyridoxamine 5'-phosphate oxidase superfamily)